MDGMIHANPYYIEPDTFLARTGPGQTVGPADRMVEGWTSAFAS